MQPEVAKAKVFLARLLSNPMLEGYTPLQKEEQILQLFSTHSSQLAALLATNEFFPGKSWTTLLPILIQALFDLTDQDLLRDLDEFMEAKLSLTFLPFLAKQTVPEEQIKNQLKSLLIHILKSPEGRKCSTGTLTAIRHGGMYRYVDQIFERKSYIHFELTKIQRLRMSKEEIKGVLILNLLLKNSFILYMGSGMDTYSDPMAGLIQGSFAEKVVPVLQKRIPDLPFSMIESAIHANLSFSEHRNLEATARLGAIFASRYRSFRAGIKVDRGADTPDKSWFNIARKNYKFYGFDGKMLDELYKIAAEMGW